MNVLEQNELKRQQSHKQVFDDLVKHSSVIESYDLLNKIKGLDVSMEDWLKYYMGKSTWIDPIKIKHDTACEIKNAIGNAVYNDIVK